ncbi:MAG: MalY/PatB family protein [Clostridia bacterium]
MFDFDTVIDRRGTGACKWERRSAYECTHGILPMSVADMELPVAPCVREAVVKAAEHGVYGYTEATPRYYDALLGWMKARHGMAATAGDVASIGGVVPALGIAIRAFTRPGEGVIVQPPVYPPFRASVERNGRRVELCPLALTDGRYEMDFEALERAAKKPDVTLLLLCSPHNPVGRVWTREELLRVEEICRANGVLVVSDEIHSDLILTGKHIPYANLSDAARAHCIVCTAPSKTFNIPGLQCANVFAFDEDLRARFKAQAQIDGFDNLSYFGYAAAIAAYEGGSPWLDAVLAYIQGNYDCLVAFLSEHMQCLKVFPMEGTYLAWVDFRALGLDNQALEHFTREEAHLILDEGYIFGPEGDGFERINLALPRAELQKALERLLDAYRRRF